MKTLFFFSIFIFPVLGLADSDFKILASTPATQTSQQINISWLAAANSVSPDDWIGLYGVNAQDGIFHKAISWRPTQGATKGLMAFTMPQMPGQYEFRYFSGSAYNVVAKTAPIQVFRPQLTSCLPNNIPRSKIEHLVVIVQENHSFDSYFGNYCRAPVGSNPDCTDGPDCCEMAPLIDAATGVKRTKLEDWQNMFFGPIHTKACETEEMNGGKMNRYVAGTSCSDPRNFAVADNSTVATYLDYAKNYAMADRYFQPVIGASSSNDMYLARGAFVFTDNDLAPNSKGAGCTKKDSRVTLNDPTIGDLLASCNVPWSFFAAGYSFVLADPFPNNILCSQVVYDPTDNPFQYYANFKDNFTFMKDLHQFSRSIASRTLPSVSYIKGLGAFSEHPGWPISPGIEFTNLMVQKILQSPVYKDNTLILVTADESGGYADHITPPGISPIDNEAYGPRTFLIALGNFAKKNYVSHVVMEHSSIVKFIEWNFLGGEPGQLHTRDSVVNNLGDLLDPAKTGVPVPVN